MGDILMWHRRRGLEHGWGASWRLAAFRLYTCCIFGAGARARNVRATELCNACRCFANADHWRRGERRAAAGLPNWPRRRRVVLQAFGAAITTTSRGHASSTGANLSARLRAAACIAVIRAAAWFETAVLASSWSFSPTGTLSHLMLGTTGFRYPMLTDQYTPDLQRKL